MSKFKTTAAVLFEANKPLELVEIELDPPGPDQVLIKILASGVCHSDLNAIESYQSADLPVVLGHEASGEIVQLGSNVSHLKVGQRVVLSWLPSCGNCYYCRAGQPSLCQSAIKALWAGTLMDDTRKIHYRGNPIFHYSLLSTFAHHAVVDAVTVVPIEMDIDPAASALVGCAVSTGVGAVLNIGALKATETVAIFGVGGVGTSAVLGAKAGGASVIIALDAHESRIKTAIEAGASHGLSSLSENWLEEIMTLTSGHGVDLAIEASGSPGGVARAYDATRKGGRIVSVGIGRSNQEVTLDAARLTREQKAVMGCFYGGIDPMVHIPAYLDLYQSGALNLDLLVSKRYKLEAVNDAFSAMTKGEVARAVIDMTI